jgi:hypothetical protein
MPLAQQRLGENDASRFAQVLVVHFGYGTQNVEGVLMQADLDGFEFEAHAARSALGAGPKMSGRSSWRLTVLAASTAFARFGGHFFQSQIACAEICS